MLASQISRLLNGKRIGHGKYVARCPAHDDSKPSLSIKSGRTCVLLKCWPGCTPEEIVRAMGLKMRDLWYDQDTITPEVSQHIKDENRLRALERMIGWAIVLAVVECNPDFTVLEEKWTEERKQLIFRLFPLRKTAYDLQMRIKTKGWEQLWEEFWQENPRLERHNPIVQPLQTTLF